MVDLIEKHCQVCEGGMPPLTQEEATALLKRVNGWEIISSGKEILRVYGFKNFYHTMSFVNAVAFIANKEGHHPDMEIGYNYCRVRYTTHAIGGLSENDFICAAKINNLGL